MAAHRAAGGLVGEHAISVVLNVGDVVERAQQCARVQNRNHAIRAVSTAILDNTCLHGSDAAVALYAGFQINDRARASAMRPENFFPRVGDFDWSLGLAGGDSSDDFERNDFALAAETSANQRLDYAYLRHRHFQHER